MTLVGLPPEGVCIQGGSTSSEGGLPPSPPSDTRGYGQQAGGTHPTEMHSCFNFLHSEVMGMLKHCFCARATQWNYQDLIFVYCSWYFLYFRCASNDEVCAGGSGATESWIPGSELCQQNGCVHRRTSSHPEWRLLQRGAVKDLFYGHLFEQSPYVLRYENDYMSYWANAL